MHYFVRSARLAGLALVVSGVAASAQTPIKIAFIRSQDIIAAAPGRAEAEAQFNREMATYRAQVQRMGDSLNTLIADYNKQETSLSPAARQTRQATIRTREQEYQQRTQQLEQEAQKRQLDLVSPIYDQIHKIIDGMRAEENYTMIIDVNTDARTVVSYDRALDITDRVIARVQQAGVATARPSLPSTPTSGAPLAAPAGVTRPKSPPTR